MHQDTNGKMRVVQIGPVPPPHGGVSTNMLAIHDALLAAGHESSIIDVTQRRRRQGLTHVYEPGSSFSLLRALISTKCDIVHYHIGGDFSPKLALFTLFCGSLPGKKFVVTFHSGGFAKDSISTASPISLRGFAFRSADLLIGVNEQMIEMFHLYGADPGQCRLILPFDLKKPAPNVPIPDDVGKFVEGSDPFLLSVGALEPEYLNHELIDSMPAIVAKWPAARLIIAGSGSMQDELGRFVAARGLEDRILLPGNLDREVLLRLITVSNVVFRLTEYDGDAISVREALFLGRPVIASDNVQRPRDVLLVPRSFSPEILVNAVSKARESQFSGHSVSDIEPLNSGRVLSEYCKLLMNDRDD